MNNVPRSAALMSALLKNVPGLMDLARSNPDVLETIKDEVSEYLPSPAFLGDKVIYRTVVIALGSVAVIAVVGAILLTVFTSQPIPDIVTALGSAAIGAMAGLLTPSPPARAGS